MKTADIHIRPAGESDLNALNRVIEAAVMTWGLPERVKRLSLPVYRYTPLDLLHLDMVVAGDRHGQVVGVAAWEEAEPKDTPAGHCALLLHGIYVDPSQHRRGIGQGLLCAVEAEACRRGYDGLLVRAQKDATAFFESRGMHRLEIDAPSRQYANRLWKDLTQAPCAGCG